MRYSKGEGVVTWSGGQAVLRKDAAYSDDNPLVLERPDLFTDTEPQGNTGRIQTNMQGPGEFRTEQGPSRVRRSQA